jgi:hypothetical protein
LVQEAKTPPVRRARRLHSRTVIIISILSTIAFALTLRTRHGPYLDATVLVVSGEGTATLLAGVVMVGDDEAAPITLSRLEVIRGRERMATRYDVSELIFLLPGGVEDLVSAEAEGLDHLLAGVTALEDEVGHPVVRRDAGIASQVWYFGCNLDHGARIREGFNVCLAFEVRIEYAISDIVPCDPPVEYSYWVRLCSWWEKAIIAEAEAGALDYWRVGWDSRIAAVHTDIALF